MAAARRMILQIAILISAWVLSHAGPQSPGLEKKYQTWLKDEVNDLITKQVDPDANVIFGTTIDPALDDKVRVTVIATGFDRKKNLLHRSPEAEIDRMTGTSLKLVENKNQEPQARKAAASAAPQAFKLDYEKHRARDFSKEDLEIPAFLRRSQD